MYLASFFDEATNTATHIVADAATGRAAIVDPVLDYDPFAGRTSTRSADTLIEHVRAHALKVDWVLETHVHADHLSAAPYLKAELGAAIGIGAGVTAIQEMFGAIFNCGPEFATDGSQFDHLFAEGERFRIGELEAETWFTPGHTPACATYLIGDAAFVGDTLFMPDYGTARTDFPGGDAATLYRSIRRILSLPAETRLYLCHDYRSPEREVYAWETTVAAQRASNVHINDGVSEAEFVKLRNERDALLLMPALLLPAVQVNMRAGHLPPAEDNGVSYLKIPVNQI